MDNKKRKTLIAVIGLLGALAIISGVTYAWFTYSKSGAKDNTITAGRVEFIYNEGQNALSLNDAMPMTDAQGKAQTAPAYFDFSIASKTGSSFAVPYTVTVRVKPQSNANEELNPEYVKVWLSDQSNSELEQGVDGTKFFQDTATPSRETGTFLEAFTDTALNPAANNHNERVIYSGIVPANSNNYRQDFRLRMWIDINTNFAPVDRVQTPASCTLNDNPVNDINGETPTVNNCKGEGYVWTDAVIVQEYPNNGKKFTVVVNVYANGEVVSEQFDASEVGYSVPAGITTSCTGANANVSCALGELETLLGS